MLIPLVLATAGSLMYAAEKHSPRRDHQHTVLWRMRAVGLSVVQIAAAGLGAWLLDPYLQGLRWVDASSMGPVWGSVYGYLGITFIWYWWHRARHEVPFLWRLLHQVHHSPTRLELLTTYYKHPLESVSNVVLGGIAMYLVLGLDPTQSATVAMLCGLAEYFYHWNVKTPRWLGWLVQRPESHCVHHEMGRHGSNYGDLPLWDWMFGTLDNPETDEVACGFGNDENRLREMLRGEVVA